MSWQAHVSYTIKRVNKVFWQLSRFKQPGASTEKLIVFYTVKIRTILMFGAACFHSSLTSDQSDRLELQQKRSLAIILGKKYRNYKNARTIVNLPSLRSLRESVCLKWAVKATASAVPAMTRSLNQNHRNTTA